MSETSEEEEKKWHKDHLDYLNSKSFDGKQRLFSKTVEERIKVIIKTAEDIEKSVYEGSNRADMNSTFASLWRLMDRAFKLAENCPKKRDREKEEEKISQAFDNVFTRLEKALLKSVSKDIAEEDREVARKKIRTMFNGVFTSIWTRRKIRVLENLERAKKKLDSVYEYAMAEAMKFPEEDRESAIRDVDKEFEEAYKKMSLPFVSKAKRRGEELKVKKFQGCDAM